MRTMDDRIAAVARLGFTERQARFLAHVMLFSGICLPRQYARSAGIAYGHNVAEFFARLVRDGDATAWRSLHNRGRLYHVRGRRLYEAIGEPRHRHRRPVPVRQVTERLMRLDSLLAEPQVRWLPSEAEKVEYVRSVSPPLSAEGVVDVGSASGGRGLPVVPAQVLVGIGESKPMFVYVVSSSKEDDWRLVLAQCGRLLAGLPCWLFRAYFPPELKPQLSRFHFVFQEELAAPLSAATVNDLRWYSEQIRTPATARTPRERERFRDWQLQLLVTVRYRVLHQRWRVHGDAAFDVASSSEIAEHLARHTGQVQCLLLPVSYRQAAPIVTPPSARGFSASASPDGLLGMENRVSEPQQSLVARTEFLLRKREFEQSVYGSVNPSACHRLRVVVRNSRVRAFVGNAETPALDVRELPSEGHGQVGVFADDGTTGVFADLRDRGDRTATVRGLRSATGGLPMQVD